MGCEGIILIVILVAVLYTVDELYKSYKSIQEEHKIKAIEQSILEATGSADITRLVMLLRQDLYSHSRTQEKLQGIAANPELATIAFRTAMKSKDAKMQKVGIKGFLYLNHAEAIVPILEVHKNRRSAKSEASSYHSIFDRRTYNYSNTVMSEASYALIKLAKIAPIKGQGGFLAIFQQFVNMICAPPPSSLSTKIPSLSTKIGYIEKLLRIANQRQADFPDKEYDALFDLAIRYSDHLALSQHTLTRHEGEDFRKTIESIQSEQERLWGWTQRKQKQRWQEQQEQRKQKRQGQAKDYYKILQVDPSAEPEVITGAYRRLAAKYHPDVYKGQNATQKMQLINEAHAVLSDSVKRKNYDELRS